MSKIKALGIGEIGIKALNNMMKSEMNSVDYIAIDRDIKILESFLGNEKIQMKM